MTPQPGDDQDDADLEPPRSIAEAEAEVAQAEARAKAARARAIRLRRAAGPAEITGTIDDENGGSTVFRVVNQHTAPSSRSRRLGRPGRKTVTVGVGLLLALASLGSSGYMLWHHHTLMHKRQLIHEFAAAARVGVTTLMSIDAQHAEEDLQRIIDGSTGELKDQISVTASLLVKQAQDAKVSSKTTVEAAAVESATDDSAIVLILAKSDVINPDNKKRPPEIWRLSVKIEREDSQLKMSRVEFLQ